jgi:hypothetical protein
LGVSGTATAWWGGPMGSNWGPFSGDGWGDMDFSMRASGSGWGHGHGYGYGYGYPSYYGYAPYGYGYPYGTPYGAAAYGETLRRCSPLRGRSGALWRPLRSPGPCRSGHSRCT